MLVLLDAAAALAATGAAAPLVLRHLRLRSDLRWRRHETIRYAACLRNIDRLEHELGIGVPSRPVAAVAANLTQLQTARYFGNYAMTASLAPGRRWFVDDPDDVRYLRPVLADVSAEPVARETA